MTSLPTTAASIGVSTPTSTQVKAAHSQPEMSSPLHGAGAKDKTAGLSIETRMTSGVGERDTMNADLDFDHKAPGPHRSQVMTEIDSHPIAHDVVRKPVPTLRPHDLNAPVTLCLVPSSRSGSGAASRLAAPVELRIDGIAYPLVRDRTRTAKASNQNRAGTRQFFEDVLAFLTSVGAGVESVDDRVEGLESGGVGASIGLDRNDPSTRLRTLQKQQQRGIEALSISNRNSQFILRLFD